MIFTETGLPGAWLIELDPIHDDRGFFARAFSADEFTARAMNPAVAQTNLSHTLAAGTMRGFHWQDPPNGECKTVRCISGAVFNAIVDMRPDSPTYRRWYGAELSADNRRALYLPERFANGFLILADDTTLLYNVSREHRPGNERGFRWDDPAIGVEWPIEVTIVSEKDRDWARLPDLGPDSGSA